VADKAFSFARPFMWNAISNYIYMPISTRRCASFLLFTQLASLDSTLLILKIIQLSPYFSQRSLCEGHHKSLHNDDEDDDDDDD